MDLSKVQNVDKVIVAKKTNILVYSSLFKVEREKKGLEKAIEKLKEDLANAKEKEKAADNKCKEIEKRITSASSQGPSAQSQPKNMEVEMKILKEQLEESNKFWKIREIFGRLV